MKKTQANEWLRLSQVARILGVHPSTARKWSDEGSLPVHRTSGGHRRYLRSEIELWSVSRKHRRPTDADLVIQNAMHSTRMQIEEGQLQEEDWYKKLDDEARQQYKMSGRTLMHGLIGYLSSGGDAAGSEAETIGYDYASRGRRYGLSTEEATRAFLFFRNVLLEAMLVVYESAAVQSPHAWSVMFRKINQFTDRILVTIMRTYSAVERNGETRE